MKRILFVDDEPRVLEGLRRMLRGLRHEWDMEFVPGGQAALDALALRPFDVVVTDVRMPGMDGAQLLQEVMERFPTSVRIVLSGQCDRQAVLNTVKPAHQFLTKPCDSEIVRATVVRACQLRDRLADPLQRQLVSQVTSLPSTRSACCELMAEIGAAEPSLDRIGAVVSRDVGMAAKMLQLVSSGFFGSPQNSPKPSQWITRLGIETVRPLALWAAAFHSLPADHLSDGAIELLTEHSLRVAECAKAIAECETGDPRIADQACLAGLLHDVGLFILAENLPGRYGQAWTSSRGRKVSLWDIEHGRFGTTHAEIGGYLLALWGAPDAIVDAASFHHRPARSPDASFSPLAAVHVANAVVIAADLEIPGDTAPVDGQYLARIRCAGRLGVWRDLCQDLLAEEVLS